MNIINPATEEVIKTLTNDSKESLQKKYELLKLGQKAWKKKSLADRVGVIKKYAELLKSNIEELSKTLTIETGKPINEANNEINGAIGRINFFIEESEKWLGDKSYNEASSTKEVLRYEPLGVIANISAWNYPYLVGVNVQIPALIGGNAVLYKPSEYATLSGLNMMKYFHLAGLPEDVFQTAIGAGDVGKVILELPLQGYFFTGSFKTGLAIQKAVAHKLVPVGLELGGKDPLYVSDEIENIQSVAESVAEGAFYNNGQSCCAVERIYVHEKIYDKFLESFLKVVKGLKVGDPMNKETNQGSLTRPMHISFLKDQIKDALDKGAKILCGGDKLEGKGAFFSPTVMTDVNHKMNLMTEETFGPLIGIQSVASDEEAVFLMDDTEYGLTASVFCSNLERAQKILSELEVGNAYVNCSDRVSPYLPWAGQRGSGLGATLGFQGILAFVRPKGYHLRKL